MEISNEPVHLQAPPKRVSVTVEVDVPVITCKMCSASGEYLPATLVRTTADGEWKLNGVLYPKGWVNGHCEPCWATQKTLTGDVK